MCQRAARELVLVKKDPGHTLVSGLLGPPPAEPRINWFRSSELEPGTAFDEHRVEEQVRALLGRRAEGHKLAVVPTEASAESKALSPRKEVSAEEHR